LAIFNRFPKKKEIAPVYAVIVIMIYGWTIFRFNYFVPGWLYFLNLGEVMSIFAYSMVTNFLESLIVLSGVLAVGFVLPMKWFLDAFIARGASLSIFMLVLMMYVADQFKDKNYYPSDIVRWLPAILILMGLVVYLLGRVQVTRKAIEFFSDRAIIFLYITIPVSILSLIVVLVKNIY
jgi:hypothetical protein